MIVLIWWNKQHWLFYPCVTEFYSSLISSTTTITILWFIKNAIIFILNFLAKLATEWIYIFLYNVALKKAFAHHQVLFKVHRIKNSWLWRNQFYTLLIACTDVIKSSLMELFILCWFWRSLWTKAVVFHLMFGYTFPPLHSPLQEDYFPGDGPSISSWNNWISTRANPSAVWLGRKIRTGGRH